MLIIFTSASALEEEEEEKALHSIGSVPVDLDPSEREPHGTICRKSSPPKTS